MSDERFDYQRQQEDDRRRWEEYEEHGRQWRKAWREWANKFDEPLKEKEHG